MTFAEYTRHGSEIGLFHDGRSGSLTGILIAHGEGKRKV